MSLLVLKFGGTSVADVERIRNVAAHVKREVDAGHACAVVVSAMAGQTNQLVSWVEDAWGFKQKNGNWEAKWIKTVAPGNVQPPIHPFP